MTLSSDDDTFAQLVGKIDPDARLLRTWPLHGGVSAQVTALEIEKSDGRTQKLVVRRYGAVDLSQNPNVAAHEWMLVRLLHAAGVPTPAPHILDESGTIFPTPYVVMEYVDGATELAPVDAAGLAGELAAQLRRIHALDYTHRDLTFLPDQSERFAALLRARPTTVDELFDERRIRDALEAAWPLRRRNAPALLHGDFWPGNVLWKGSQVAAIIDWEDAAIGDPLADLANGRLEILWAYGVDAMRCFTEQYTALSAIDLTDLPYWDLCAALRPIAGIASWGLDEGTERRMREDHRWFVGHAFDTLAHRVSRVPER